MINILKNISRIDSLKEKNYPKHIAISTKTLKNNKDSEKNIVEQATSKFMKLVDNQIKLNIPIFTVLIENKDDLDKELVEKIINKLKESNILTENKIKFMLIGKWYDLNSNLTNQIKNIMEETSSYDNFFLNILFNYSGQEELFSAIKLLSIKSHNKQVDLEKLDFSVIKDSIYTSYFIPPELIIEFGYKFSGILLWDSPGAVIYFTHDKNWSSSEKKVLDEALALYKKASLVDKSNN